MKNLFASTAPIIIAALASGPATSGAADSWQKKLLFNPTPAQITVEESKGRVMIYHGLKDVQVARAMDQHFGRIDYMMFTGTKVTDSNGDVEIDPESGAAIVEDDGC